MTAVLTACLLSFAACGDDNDNDTDGDGSDTNSSSASTNWQDVDACTLLTDEEVGTALGTDEAFETLADDDDPERPGCTWQVQQYGTELTISLWQPPVPGALTGGDTVPVGDRTGYVQGSNESQCFMQVEGDEFWVLVDLDSDPSLDDVDFCATQAAPVAEKLFDAVEGS